MKATVLAFAASAAAAPMLAADVARLPALSGHQHPAMKGFKLDRVSNPASDGVRHGTAHYAKAARKYGFIHSLSSRDLPPGTDPATPFTVAGANAPRDFLTPVKIAGVEYLLDFDTGSSDLWIAGTQVPNVTTPFEPSISPANGLSWSIQYGDGSVASGDVYLTGVTIGPATVTGQAVERATTAGGAFFGGGCDGLLGLAFESINEVVPTQQKTWMDNAAMQGLPNVFAANLSPSGGSYDIGQVDDSAYTGSLVTVNADSSKGFWMFTPNNGATGIVDTGTTLILVSDAAAQDYYSGVKGAVNNDGWNFDCGATLPKWNLTIGDYTAVVPGDAINFAPNGDGTCYGGIQSRGTNTFDIYGDIFLRTTYVVFDRRSGQSTLSFAAKA